MSFANSIYQKGTALDNICGFVDGTLRGIARPVPNQGVTYNRHKRKHGLKYQSITTPNAIISNLFGPVEGRRHDSSMLAMSVMMPVLEHFSIGPNGERLCIYGDPAYPLRWYLQGPFRGAQITPDQYFKFKKSMSKLHISVEWLFGNVIENFKYSDYWNSQKIGLSSVGKMYRVSALLTNAHTCLYKTHCSNYFDLNPPFLEEYFR